ncbi:sushi, von Willebrand factor type A, EGF and pentraxin domain-containing protein 1-like [Glandiceps talaboti]
MSNKLSFLGGGILIIGQEQDAYGGGFSAPESFLGELSLLNIWNQVFSQREVGDILYNCEKYFGNVKSWPDFIDGIQGRIHTKSNDFCQGCQFPQTPLNGSYIGGSPGSWAEPDKEIQMSCDPAFDLVGALWSKCQIHGGWLPDLPFCRLKSCGYPGTLSDGQKLGVSYYVGDTVRWQCDFGYTLVGNAAITCTLDGTWSGAKPVCKEIECSDLPQVRYGTVTSVGRAIRRFGAQVTFTCNTGYEMKGIENVRCQSDGSWSEIPSCDPVECGPPNQISYGKVEKNGHSFGAVLRYTCDKGFVLSGGEVRSCGADGQWTGEEPFCQIVTCEQPPGILNGDMSVSAYTYGSVAEYWCHDGYILNGNAKADCTEHGNWTTPPTCILGQCSDPDVPEHGTVSVTGTRFKDTATYECYVGYDLLGVKARICGSDITWSGETPKCEPVSCGQPQKVAHGVYTDSVYLYGNVVTFECEMGYVMTGNSSITCQSNRQWTDYPECNPIECGESQVVPNAEFNSTGKTFGHVTFHQCHEGFILHGFPSQVCQHDGFWTPGPICEPVDCETPPDVANARKTGQTHIYQSVVNYDCDKGHEMNGVGQIECKSDGMWTKTPQCIIVDCGTPPEVVNAIKAASNTIYGSLVNYTCQAGYIGNDDMFIHCQTDKTWSPAPVCRPVSCGSPWSVNHSTISGGDYTFNNTVVYSCEYGYDLVGVSEHSCQENGFWSGEQPSCTLVNCGEPQAVLHSKHTGQIFTYDSSLHYTCNYGYELRGSGVVTCKGTGKWSNLPLCTPVDCGSLPTIYHGSVNATGETYNHVAQYKCSTGYRLSGNTEISCLGSGRWSDDPPSCQIVSCGLPKRVSNAEIKGSWYLFGNRVHYTCNEGYNLTGNETIECLATGNWTTSPSCSPVVCGEPEALPNGIQEYTGTVFQDRATYTCNTGYTLQGENPIVCQHTGKWSKMPVCKPVSCPIPQTVLHSSVKVTGITLGHNITYECESGYHLRGSGQMSCQPDKSWSSLPPKCEIVQCGPPVDVNYATVNGDEHTYGSVVYFQCIPGYKMLGNGTVYCQHTGKWTIPPVCSPVSCGSPEDVPHGIIKGEGYTYTQSVTHECDVGYMLKGNTQRICQANATWSGAAPVCMIISCGKPPNEPHLVQSGSQYIFGSVVNYRCDAGYRLSGNRTIMCLADGKWTPGAVCNPVDCGAPEEAPYSETFISGTTFGEDVMYQCDIGYLLEGDRQRRCLESGIWSGNVPRCEIVICGDAPVVQYASHNGSSSHDYGDVIHYACDTGYEKTENRLVKCKDSGEWTDLPACGPVSCGVPETVPNGKVEATGHTFQHTAAYTCNAGYHLRGVSVRSCLAEKVWSDIAPTCDILSCGSPPHVIHSTYSDSNGHTFGSFAVYECDSGYTSVGTSKVQCTETGQWGAPPVCTPISCGNPHQIVHGFIASSGSSYKQKILYQCDAGYQLIGDAEQECLANGHWSGTPPECNIRSCGLPYEVANGDFTGEMFTFGSIVTYTCHIGYNLKGSQRVECLANAVWTPEPTCTPVLCGQLEEVQHAIATFTGHTYSHVVNYACHIGYTLIGDEQRICQAEGKWSGESPVCEIVTCGSVPTVQFAFQVGSDNTFNSIVRYTCQQGYELRGERIVKCEASGEWSTPPVCIPVTCRSLTDIPHGVLFMPDNTYTGIATYECQTGYRIRGSRQRRCLANRFWSGSLPVCQLISCGQPEDVQHATYSDTEFTFGSSVSYICDVGYDTVGDPSVECVASGLWTQNPVCMPINCGAPPPVPHGIAIGDDFSYGKVIRISCRLGYTVKDKEENMRCQANKMWSAAPECVPQNCGEPKPVPHATMRGSRYTYGSRVYFDCNTGYELHGSDLMLCQVSGEWTAPPTCTPVTCGNPDGIEHAILSSTGHSFTDIVTYHCEDGYNLDGQNQRECQSNGQWSGELPQCLRISCGPPKKTDYAVLLDTDYFYNSVARYNCRPGYELIGADQVICTSSGSWSPEPPVCNIINCVTPNPIPHGSVHGHNFSYNSVVTYSCDSGYKLHGVGSQTCLLNKTWSYTPPICQLIKCNAPEDIPNGRFVGDNFFYGWTVQYSCDLGYILHGEGIRRCQADSSWSGPTPSCKPLSCGAPSAIANGRHIVLLGHDYNLGRRIRYICDAGYTSSADGVQVCMNDGLWHGEVPVCSRISCGQPVVAAHSFIKSSSYEFENIVEYDCMPGYDLKGESSRQCQSNGQWSGAVPTCEPVSCGPPPTVIDATAHGGHVTFNSIVSYTCNVGYDLQGSNTIQCLANSSWSVVTIVCTPALCGKPPRLRNGNYHGKDYTFGHYVHYYCHPGYILQGGSNQLCGADGQWNGTSPRCLPIQCGTPPQITAGSVMGNDWTLGNTVHYDCYDGYNLRGNSSRTCQANGEWSGHTPHCQPISCGLPPTVAYSHVSGVDYHYREYVVYVCQEGYELHGNSVRRCQADGSWSGRNLTCQPVSCRPPGTPNHGSVASNENTYGSKAYFTCQEGYILQGPSQRTCLSNGEWSGDMPRCDPVSCNHPPSIPRSVSLTSDNRIIYNSNREFYFGNIVRYLCQQGYRIEGNVEIECNSDGQWSTPPTCQPLSCSVVASIDFGYVSAPSHKVNATITYGCYTGYQLHGSATSVCQTDQTWSHPPPFCSPVSCGTPKVMSNSLIDGDPDYTYGKVITYRCVQGYEMIGNSTSMCQENKRWSEALGNCMPVNCGPAPDVPNAVRSTSGQYFGDKATYTCEDDFVLEGSNEAKCAANGRWHGVPACVERSFEAIEEAVCILPCLHGGTCVAPYQCKCPPGYTGSRCENALCHGQCMIRGRCYGRNRCRCPPGRGGNCNRSPRSGVHL